MQQAPAALNGAAHPGPSEASGTPARSLLGPLDPPAVSLERPHGGSAVFITCEHAGREVPRNLDRLGLPDFEFDRHVAWDIGAAAVARRLSARLDATLVLQAYSRLVIDCNRALDRHDSIPTVSDGTLIPANQHMHPDEAALRAEEIFTPYHRTIRDALDHRQQQARLTVLVAVHSFTPTLNGIRRPWDVGLLFNRDARFARIVGRAIGRRTDLCVADNQPYAISDQTDYTIPVHGELRGIPHIEFEIRQDLIATEQGQREWAGYLEDWLLRSLDMLAGRLDGDCKQA